MRRRRVTPESVRQFAQRYLAPNARVVVHGIPGKQNLGPEVPKPAEQAPTCSGAGGWQSTPTSHGARSSRAPAPRKP